MKKPTSDLDYLEAHVKLWQWLEESPEKGKEDWFGWRDNGGSYKPADSACFMCQQCKNDCSNCLLDWGYYHSHFPCLSKTPGDFKENGIFGKWNNAKTSKTRIKYARIIKQMGVDKISEITNLKKKE